MSTMFRTTDGEGFGEAAHFSTWEAQMVVASMVQMIEQLKAREIGELSALAVGRTIAD